MFIVWDIVKHYLNKYQKNKLEENENKSINYACKAAVRVSTDGPSLVNYSGSFISLFFSLKKLIQRNRVLFRQLRLENKLQF